jgi:hypothetical protein
MSIASVFLIDKKWQQTECLSPDEWIKNVYVQCGMKKNEVLSFQTTCLEMEIIMLNEKSQAQKDKYPHELTCGI